MSSRDDRSLHPKRWTSFSFSKEVQKIVEHEIMYTLERYGRSIEGRAVTIGVL